MPGHDLHSLRSSLITAGNLASRVYVGAGASASWGELVEGSFCDQEAVDLHGRSVLLATFSQLAAAAALIQLDGVARRIVLYPPDLSLEHLAFVTDVAATDLIVTDQPTVPSICSRIECLVPKDWKTPAKAAHRNSPISTEWILLTSGTTGLPKLVKHTLASLAGAIRHDPLSAGASVWSTFYDIRRYGGLQIFLRAALTGTSLVLGDAQDSTADLLLQGGELGITHISGTPSHWRRALMSSLADRITPSYVRLSGEIADQSILNQLRSQYPNAKIAHAFASTEAGVAFEVNDGLTGFPADTIEKTRDVEMKVEGHTLRIRSNRTAFGYLGGGHEPLKDDEGFVDTGDVLELRDDRYYFAGRRDGTINVGGFKVHPEEVEAVINRHPEVIVSLVKSKKNPITGTLVVADVVLKTRRATIDSNEAQPIERGILQFCRGELPPHKVPAVINLVPSLAMAVTGKLIRPRA